MVTTQSIGDSTVATPNSFQCPYCLHYSVVREDQSKKVAAVSLLESASGATRLVVTNWACQNSDCGRLSVHAELFPYTLEPNLRGTGNQVVYGERLHFWRLLPDSLAKPQPEYIPQQIRDDYYEACQIRDLSAKAAATLSRRCLQGMIRDFWGIKKKNLSQAITALKPHVDGTTWKAIEAVRKVGNIGAHMEKDINLIIDVDPKEAGLLIDLIERLLKEWYVARHDREQSMGALLSMAGQKEKARKGKPDGSDPTGADADVQDGSTDNQANRD